MSLRRCVLGVAVATMFVVFSNVGRPARGTEIAAYSSTRSSVNLFAFPAPPKRGANHGESVEV